MRGSGLWRGGSPGRPPGVPNRATQEVRPFCQRPVADPEYRAAFEQRWRSGTLPPAMEALIWAYAIGKPGEYLDLKDGLTKLGDHSRLTVEQQAQEARHFAVGGERPAVDRLDVHKLFDLTVDARVKGSTEVWAKRYGAPEREQLAAGVEQFIESRPDLAKQLGGGLLPTSHGDGSARAAGAEAGLGA